MAIFFNDDNEGVGTLSCPSGEVLDIKYVNYLRNNSERCNLACRVITGYTYLSGQNEVCQNENNIRSTCYARNRCQVRNVRRPNIKCPELNNRATHILVSYRCASTGELIAQNLVRV